MAECSFPARFESLITARLDRFDSRLLETDPVGVVGDGGEESREFIRSFPAFLPDFAAAGSIASNGTWISFAARIRVSLSLLSLVGRTIPKSGAVQHRSFNSRILSRASSGVIVGSYPRPSASSAHRSTATGKSSPSAPDRPGQGGLQQRPLDLLAKGGTPAGHVGLAVGVEDPSPSPAVQQVFEPHPQRLEGPGGSAPDLLIAGRSSRGHPPGR